MQVPGLSYYNFRMRSKLLALLIALLPLQLCWAAVAPYIHEDARGAAHIAGVHGLEIMQSQEGPLDVSPALQIGLDSSQKADASGVDVDCGVCHSHSPAAPQHSLMTAIAVAHGVPSFSVQ